MTSTNNSNKKEDTSLLIQEFRKIILPKNPAGVLTIDMLKANEKKELLFHTFSNMDDKYDHLEKKYIAMILIQVSKKYRQPAWQYLIQSLVGDVEVLPVELSGTEEK